MKTARLLIFLIGLCSIVIMHASNVEKMGKYVDCCLEQYDKNNKFDKQKAKDILLLEWFPHVKKSDYSNEDANIILKFSANIALGSCFVRLCSPCCANCLLASSAVGVCCTLYCKHQSCKEYEIGKFKADRILNNKYFKDNYNRVEKMDRNNDF